MTAALFFDVDGTLTDSYHNIRTIPSTVRAELARVQQMGHKILLSSGRPPLQITPELLEPGFDGLVLINGGYVEIGGRTVYEERMPHDLARQLADFVAGLGYEYLITTAHHVYMQRSNTEFYSFFARAGHANIFTYDYDLDEVLTRTIKMEALVPSEERERVTARALEVLGPDISCDGHGGHGTYELYPTAISKAKGISVALEHLGVAREDSYGFGDGTNDLEMIRYCGHGIAMGNAEDVVKQAADMVCPPVWEDGLAQALRELF